MPAYCFQKDSWLIVIEMIRHGAGQQTKTCSLETVFYISAVLYLTLLKVPAGSFLTGQTGHGRFLSPHLFVWIYCADLRSELTQVFTKNTHVYFTNDRVQLLGQHPFGWWFSILLCWQTDVQAWCSYAQRSRFRVYDLKGIYPFMQD